MLNNFPRCKFRIKNIFQLDFHVTQFRATTFAKTIKKSIFLLVQAPRRWRQIPAAWRDVNHKPFAVSLSCQHRNLGHLMASSLSSLSMELTLPSALLSFAVVKVSAAT